MRAGVAAPLMCETIEVDGAAFGRAAHGAQRSGCIAQAENLSVIVCGEIFNLEDFGDFRPVPENAAMLILRLAAAGQLDRLDMTGMFAGLLERCCPIKAIAISGRWCEVDNSNDLFVYENMINSHKAWTHDWRE